MVVKAQPSCRHWRCHSDARLDTLSALRKALLDLAALWLGSASLTTFPVIASTPSEPLDC
jgi:hypothetical protein